MSKELEQLILSKSRPVQKEVKQLQKSELDRLIIEAFLGEKREFSEYSEEQQSSINDVIKTLKTKFPNIALKSDTSTQNRVVLHNTGDDKLRGDGVELAMKELDGAGKPFFYYNNNPKLPKIGFTYKGLNFVLKKGSGKKGGGFNATKFEGDLITAIADINGFSADVGEYKNGGIYEDVAKENIENTSLKSGASSAGLAKSSPLTETYTKHGVKSGTPKADILVDDARVSVKKYEASQLMSAQGPEFAAVIDAAALSLGSAATPTALDAISNLMKPAKLGGKFEKAKEETGGAFDFQRSLQTLLGFKEGGITSERVDEVSQLIANKVLLKETQTLAQVINSEIINTPEFKMAILREAVTGAGKFTNNEAIADHILKWSIQDPKRASYNVLDDEYYAKLMGETSFGIRSRGNDRGLAARIDRTGKIDEQLLTEAENKLLEEKLDLMLEGLFTDLLNKAKDAGTKVFEKAKQIYETIKKSVIQYVSKFLNYLKNLAKQGFSYLLQFLGMIDEDSKLIIGNP